MSKLPNVFANPINKRINNVQESFYSSKNTREVKMISEKEIRKKIDQIFASRSHIAKSRVIITLKDGQKECDLIGKSANNILTMDGSLISISDILNIEKK